MVVVGRSTLLTSQAHFGKRVPLQPAESDVVSLCQSVRDAAELRSRRSLPEGPPLVDSFFLHLFGGRACVRHVAGRRMSPRVCFATTEAAGQFSSITPFSKLCFVTGVFGVFD